MFAVHNTLTAMTTAPGSTAAAAALVAQATMFA